jgi:hypothetical protein
MTQRDRIADSALWLVAGIAVALLFLVWTVPEFRYAASSENRQQQVRQTAGDQKPVETSGFWKTYTTPSDTYAQWIAAFSAFFGVGVSFWAVRLVRDTLAVNKRATDAAESAVAETRRIGEAQIRAYISVTHVEAGLHRVPYIEGKEMQPYDLWVHLAVGNGGQTPARRIRTAISVERQVGEDLELIGGEFKLIQNVDIRPGQTDYVVCDQEFHVPGEIGERFKKGEISFLLRGHVVYDPVVGPQRRETPFAYLLSYAGENRSPSVSVTASIHVTDAT